MEQKNKTHTINDLEKLYTDAEQADSEIFAEMRSNLLLISGEHYNKRKSAFYNRMRDTKEITEQQKLRLVKNHIQKIVKTYVNNIVSLAPGVGFSPKNENELQDQKAAELHHAVWRDAVDRYNIDELVEDWCDDFVGIGEVATKIFYDPQGGKILGHRQEMDPETGELLVDENGEPRLGEAEYEGEFQFEQVYGFNLLRPAECKDLRKATWLCIRKMVAKDLLIEKFPDKKSLIVESADTTMVVFDGAKGGYRKTNNEVLLKEYYFKPCSQYPRGYFFYATKEGILVEGELPGGIYPLVVRQYEKTQTSPRGRSPVKDMRPYQGEINRAASKIAEHQITLGDDKLIIRNGTKVSAGTALPGIRSISVTGEEPTILGGRDGSQYLNYMNSQIEEMYSVMNVAEDDKDSGQVDPFTMLFKSANQKKKFNRYVRRFEKFLIDVCKTYLQLAKLHMSDDQVVLAIGRSEKINIAEFKSALDICYQIKVEPQSDDVETKMGKQMALNHALQYVGNKLDKEDIGKIMRAMPYGNFDESFSDMTINYDSATNMILALDRGEWLDPSEYDDPKYMISRLTLRMRQADFRNMDPQIVQMYQQMVQIYEQIEVAQIEKLKAAESELIPTGGYMVVCDIYTTDPTDKTGMKTRRARIPYESLQWLIKQLETQGQSLDALEQMNQGAMTQMAQMFLNKPAEGMPEGVGRPLVTPA